jgi:hypothetical protein
MFTIYCRKPGKVRTTGWHSSRWTKKSWATVEEAGAELEKIAYIRLIVQQEKVEDVSEELKISNRSLYNAKQRALKKIRNKINK